MLWLYNSDPNITFFQVFLSNNKVYSDETNNIYNFNYLENSENSEFFDIKTDSLKYEKLKFQIKILDNLILFYDIENNKSFVFSNKMNFIKPNNNFNLPIFNYVYKKVNSNRMPNLIESNYSFVSELDFEIYNINKNLQFIIETNPKNMEVKKYFITNDLNQITNFIKNK